jgi:hypothetical protein
MGKQITLETEDTRHRFAVSWRNNANKTRHSIETVYGRKREWFNYGVTISKKNHTCSKSTLEQMLDEFNQNYFGHSILSKCIYSIPLVT